MDRFDFGAVVFAEEDDSEFLYFLLQFCMPGEKGNSNLHCWA